MSNQELSRHMELSPASITHLLQPLVTRGILDELPPEAYSDSLLQEQQRKGLRRRRKITVYPDRKLGYILSAEATPDSLILRKVLFDLSTDPFELEFKIAGRSNLVDALYHTIGEIQLNDPRRLLAVGVTISGLKSADGKMVAQSTYQGWLEKVSLVEHLGQKLDVPVVLVNDANALAVYERFVGKAKQVDHFFNLYINQGVGLGMFTNGRLYDGYLHQAGEPGHWIMDPQGAEQPGLPRGSFQTYVSEQAIHSRLVAAGYQIKREETYPTLLAELLTKGDSSPAIMQILDEIAGKTALLCSNLMNIFAPRKIYIYGPLAELGDLFLSRVRTGIGLHTASLRKDGISDAVELSTDWRHAMKLGTAKFAMDAYLERMVQATLEADKIPRHKPVRVKPVFNTPQRRFLPPGSPRDR